MINMIAAVSRNGIIGQNNSIPFHYPEDLRYFKEKTLNSTVIMGRKTYESVGKPLPKRNNVIISSKIYSEVMSYPTLKNALVNINDLDDNIWLIGGSLIYEEGMLYCDKILLTITPDIITGDNLIKFPWINPTQFSITSVSSLGDVLQVVEYTRL